MLERERRGRREAPKTKAEGERGQQESSLKAGAGQRKNQRQGNQETPPAKPAKKGSQAACPHLSSVLGVCIPSPRGQALLHPPQATVCVDYTVTLPPCPGSGTLFRDWDQSGAPQYKADTDTLEQG